jgi:hypothetical protein
MLAVDLEEPLNDRFQDELEEIATVLRYKGLSPRKAEERAFRILSKRYPEAGHKSRGC